MTRLKKGVMIAEVTNEDCQKLLDEETIVMLPIGGGSKEHGGSLPQHGLCRRRGSGRPVGPAGAL